MNFFEEIVTNRVLMSGIIAWMTAQVVKFLIHGAIDKAFRLERLFGDGGMPSAHSATVTSMATMAAITYTLNSFEFAISAMLAIIVMHDAHGVRRETGKQSVVLNNIMETFSAMQVDGKWSEEKLKEFIGHTPLQVAAGFIVGLVVGLIMGYGVFGVI